MIARALAAVFPAAEGEFSDRRVSSINQIIAAGNKRGVSGKEESHEWRNLFGPTQPPERVASNELFLVIGWKIREEWRLDVSGSYAVDPQSLRTIFCRGVFRQPDHPVFGSRISAVPDRSDGSVNLEKTEFYVPNEYVFKVAEQHPDKFVPNISVNPYRPDAIAELEKWAKRGARIVKWLPNAMGINPSDPQCDPFYQKMKELDLILLSHGGEEKAVEAEEDQKLGNPLLLRRALDHGVKVIVAHCAGLGTNEDLESKDRQQRDNFDLFLRLMDEKRYEGLVFGEISAMTQFNRIGKPLQTVLNREDLHERLVNGSDYPLPAVNILIRTRPLVKHGHLTRSEGECLREIYDYNPLLFDFVLKRTLKRPGTSKILPAALFMTNPALSV